MPKPMIMIAYKDLEQLDIDDLKSKALLKVHTDYGVNGPVDYIEMHFEYKEHGLEIHEELSKLGVSHYKENFVPPTTPFNLEKLKPLRG